MLNSRPGLFTATPSGSRCSPFTLLGHPFSRSYGVFLPSSLARVLSRALGSSPRLPVSVCGTVSYTLLRGFSRQCGFSSFEPFGPPHHLSGFMPDGFSYLAPYWLGRALPSSRSTYPPASPLRSLSGITGSGILTGYPSPTDLSIGLGPPNPGQTNFTQETLGLRRERFSLSFSLLMPAFSLLLRPALFASTPSTYRRTLPYRLALTNPTASVLGLVPLHFRRKAPRPVSYYALFE